MSLKRIAIAFLALLMVVCVLQGALAASKQTQLTLSLSQDALIISDDTSVHLSVPLNGNRPSIAFYELQNMLLGRIYIPETDEVYYFDIAPTAVDIWHLAMDFDGVTVDSSLNNRGTTLLVGSKSVIGSLEILAPVDVKFEKNTYVSEGTNATSAPSFEELKEELQLVSASDVKHIVLPAVSGTASGSSSPKKPTAPKGKINFTKEHISNLSGTLEYTSDNWKTAYTVTLNKGAMDISKIISDTSNITLKLRKPETESQAAGPEQSFTIPKRPAAPNGEIDYERETISGLKGALEYSLDKWATAHAIALEKGRFAIAGLIPTRRSLHIQVRVPATATAPHGLAQVLEIPARPQAPKGALNMAKAQISGLSGVLEYSFSNWRYRNDVVLANGIMDISQYLSTAEAKNMLLRYKANSSEKTFASLAQSFTFPKPPPAPNGVFDPIKLTISGLTGDMIYTIDSEDWTDAQKVPLSNGVWNIASLLSSDKDVIIRLRKPATDKALASAIQKFTFRQRIAQPSLSVDFISETLDGSGTNLEYTINNWSSSTSVEFKNGRMDISKLFSINNDITLQVRVKASGNTPAGLAWPIKLPKRPAPPTGSIDYENETITDIDERYELSVDNGKNYSGVILTDNVFALSGHMGKTILLRLKATQACEHGEAKSYAIPTRPANPVTGYAIKPGTEPGTITLTYSPNVNGMVYAVDNGSWTDAAISNKNIPANIGSLLSLRKAHTASSFASKAIEITIKSGDICPEEGPLLTIDYEAETLSGITSEQEFSVDNGKTYKPFPLSNGQFIISSYIGNTIFVRYAATDYQPASQPTQVSVASRPKSPDMSGVSITYGDETLVGLNKSWQYSTDGAIFNDVQLINNTLVITKYIGQLLYFRVPASNSNSSFASDMVKLTIPSRPAAPNAALSPGGSNNATCLTFNANGHYAYQINQGSWQHFNGISVDIPNVNVDDEITWYSMATAKAFYSEFDSATVQAQDILTLSAISCSLDYVTETLSIQSQPGFALEYSINNWQTSSIFDTASEKITSLISTESNTTIQIRYALTKAYETQVVLPKREAAPNASVDYAKEEIVITSSGRTIEYSRDAWNNTLNVSDSSIKLTELSTSESFTYQLRCKADQEQKQFASNIKTLTIPKRPTITGVSLLSGTMPNTVILNTTGDPAALRYRIGGSGDWHGLSGAQTSLTVTAFSQVQVYQIPSNENFSSEIKKMDVTSDLLIGLDAPSIEIDYAAEEIVISNPIAGVALEYTTTGWNSARPVPSPFSISSLISNAENVSIWVRYKADNGQPENKAAKLVLPKRPAKPDGWQVYSSTESGTFSLLNVSTAMEYRVGNGSYCRCNASIVGGISATANETVYVRFAHTSSSFASLPDDALIPELALYGSTVSSTNALPEIEGVNFASGEADEFDLGTLITVDSMSLQPLAALGSQTEPEPEDDLQNEAIPLGQVPALNIPQIDAVLPLADNTSSNDSLGAMIDVNGPATPSLDETEDNGPPFQEATTPTSEPDATTGTKTADGTAAAPDNKAIEEPTIDPLEEETEEEELDPDATPTPTKRPRFWWRRTTVRPAAELANEEDATPSPTPAATARRSRSKTTAAKATQTPAATSALTAQRADADSSPTPTPTTSPSSTPTPTPTPVPQDTVETEGF